MPVDVTDKYVRIRQKDPDDFIEGSFKTVALDEAKGIMAVMGKVKGESKMTIQSYLFDKEKWDTQRATAWVEKHKGGYSSKDWQARMTGYEGHRHIHCQVRGTFFALTDTSKDKPGQEFTASAPIIEAIAADLVPTEILLVPTPIWSTSKY